MIAWGKRATLLPKSTFKRLYIEKIDPFLKTKPSEELKLSARTHACSLDRVYWVARQVVFT